ncbi:MAG TPA: hypothetical protein PLQ11_04535 [Beijerinckiaceae bacterium]|nr:hypothetical protein [Beijerinckiaceae bacterium]
MDVNAVFECIGFGASRAVASANFVAGTSSRVPARYILETARDPVAYCIEALARHDPEAAARIRRPERVLILERLRREAGLVRH